MLPPFLPDRDGMLPSGDWPATTVTASCPPDEVHLWRIDVARAGRQVDRLRQMITPDERDRADRLVRDKDRQRFTAAHAALRTLVGQYLSVPPAELRFTTGPFGKPALHGAPGDRPLEFNLAHSGRWALVAVATVPVGVDVERIRPVANFERLVARFFTPVEQQQLRAAGPDEATAQFFPLWAAKEAVLKAAGCGLQVNPGSFDIESGNEQQGDNPWASATLRWNEVPSCWRVLPLAVDDQHPGAVAVPAGDESIAAFRMRQAEWVFE